jgi:hypothetical protein
VGRSPQRKGSSLNFKSKSNLTFHNIHFRNERKVASLMYGNDLQSLEEEVSKEEDESLIIKVEMFTKEAV